MVVKLNKIVYMLQTTRNFELIKIKMGFFNFLFFVNPILEDVPVAGAQTIIQVSQNRPVGIV